MTTSERLIRLDTNQLIQIFDQVGFCGVTYDPNVHIYIKLNNEQLYPHKCECAVQTKLRNIASLNQNRINYEFLEKMANIIGLKYEELKDVIQLTDATIPELTFKLNNIFKELIEPPLTQDEVRDIVALTLPASQ